MTWRKTLRIWYLSFFTNPSLTLLVVFLFFSINFFILLPIIGLFTFLLQNIFNFSLIIFFSKVYIESKGSEEEYVRKLRAVRIFKVPFLFIREAFLLVIAQYIMTTLLVLFVVFALLIAGAILGISLLAMGSTPPWWAFLLYIAILIFLYFSIATSYPFFFARVLAEAQEPGDYLKKFLTAPFSRILMKMNFSVELMISSLIISGISFILFLVQFLLYTFIPATVLLAYFFTFANLLLLYLFGVISLFNFLWKGD